MTVKSDDIKMADASPIDAVVLWVDGNDAHHRSKMLSYIEDKSIVNSKKFTTRFEQVEEIKYTINSILKFAPFIRTIFLVTDHQVPTFLKEETNASKHKKVKIIDHETIFKGYEDYLPTFNNRSIESCICRIPELAEHFVYFNDDGFLIDHVQPEDFFINGNPVLRGKWKLFAEDKFLSKFKKVRQGHKFGQQLSAKMNGFTEYYRFRHTPHPLRKSTIENYFSIHPEAQLNNVKYRFRNPNQFLLQGVMNHFEIKNKTCILEEDLKLLYFRSYKKPLIWYKYKLNILGKNKLFLGLQSLDLAKPEILKYLLGWLEDRTN